MKLTKKQRKELWRLACDYADAATAMAYEPMKIESAGRALALAVEEIRFEQWVYGKPWGEIE